MDTVWVLTSGGYGQAAEFIRLCSSEEVGLKFFEKEATNHGNAVEDYAEERDPETDSIKWYTSDESHWICLEPQKVFEEFEED